MTTPGCFNLVGMVSTFLLLSLFTPPYLAAADPPPASRHATGIKFERPQLRFEVNEGQTDSQVRFTARDRDGIAFLTSDGAVFQVTRTVAKTDFSPGRKKGSRYAGMGSFESSFVRMKTVGANPNPRVVGLERLPGVTNYFIGNDPAKWRTDVAGYAKVKYEGVYPGIDLVYYDNGEGHLEYDFIVAPGADPSQIALSLEGAQSVELDASGALVISAATGTIRKPAPKIYQEINGKREEVAGRYRIVPAENSIDTRFAALDSRIVAFALGAYDLNRPLVIDPQVLYATYLGGSSTSTIANEGARGVAVDAQGSVYVVGVTISANFPTKNPAQNVLKGFSNAFITKLDAKGQLVYSTYLGGSGFDEGSVIKVDNTGAAYVGGTTGSSDFPTVNPALKRGGRNDGFITKLSPTGSQIVYSTYIGGSDNDGVADLALDAQKNAFVVGNVAPALGAPANDFPVVNPIQAMHAGGFRDGFVSKISASGSTLVFSTYLGGDGDDAFQSISRDPSNGRLYLGYHTNSSNFPPAIAPNVELPAVAQPNAANSGGGVLGLEPGDRAESLFLVMMARQISDDPSADFEADTTARVGGEIIMGINRLGPAPSPELPKTSARLGHAQAGGGLDVQLVAMDQNGNVSKVVFFGGSGEDALNSIEGDLQGAIYVIGRTRSTNLPVTDAIQAKHSGGNAFDGFLAAFHPQTLQPVFSTYLGGTGMEFLNGVAVDPQGNIYVVGETFGNFPNPTADAIQKQLSGRTDAFIIKISPVNISAAVVRDISISPSSLDFGTVSVGQSSDRTVTITNQVTSTEALTGAVGKLSAPFSVVSGGGAFKLAPGQSASALVRFSPTTAAQASANLSITHNATNQTSPTSVSLSGTGVATSLPDLIAAEFTGPSTALVGKKAAISFTIENQGTAPANRFKMGVYLSPDNAIAATDRQLGAKSLRALDAGGVAGPSPASFTIPKDVLPGSYFIGAVVDPQSAITESNEGNNTSSFAITVCSSVSKPKLVAPSNRAKDASTSPLLDWSDVNGAPSYDVQVATDSKFTDIVATQTGLTASEWSVAPALAGAFTYFWRARAMNACGPGPFSSNRSFKTN